MASTEERMKILKMIEEGKITPEDGAKLLAALSDTRKTSAPPRGFATNTPGTGARYFRIRVSDAASGKSKVNVNIPMGLVNVGLRMGARFAPEIAGLDMSELQNAINSGMTGKIIDVTDEEDGEHVEIFVE
ncbi:MAG TPA: hypothetical protein PLJ62_13770 [Thermoflexales bacterium]|nr:hypothetical protein [Thermoflexales bacterium]HQW37011.1 hypothetical protein [Thermoflexales bacterium]HQZ23548.1 hypothetical protein [Thermoflexales bacterium]HRA01269.1 hypothetical protein [Thermoflexales bacterium]